MAGGTGVILFLPAFAAFFFEVGDSAFYNGAFRFARLGKIEKGAAGGIAFLYAVHVGHDTRDARRHIDEEQQRAQTGPDSQANQQRAKEAHHTVENGLEDDARQDQDVEKTHDDSQRPV